MEVLEFFCGTQRHSVSFQDFPPSLQLKNCFLIKKFSVNFFFKKCSYNVSKWKYFNHSFKSTLKPWLVMPLFHPFCTNTSFFKRRYFLLRSESSLIPPVMISPTCQILWKCMREVQDLNLNNHCFILPKEQPFPR